METTTNDTGEGTPTWVGQLAMFTIHAVGFYMLYVAFVFIGPTFDDHYRSIGVASTSRFDAVMTASNWMSNWTFLTVLMVPLNGLLIHSLAKRDGRWLSRYSHTLLSALGLATFVAFAWMIHPMVWNPANAPVVPAAIVESSVSAPVTLAGHTDD